jgi:hypothetical protein
MTLNHKAEFEGWARDAPFGTKESAISWMESLVELVKPRGIAFVVDKKEMIIRSMYLPVFPIVLTDPQYKTLSVYLSTLESSYSNELEKQLVTSAAVRLKVLGLSPLK